MHWLRHLLIMAAVLLIPTLSRATADDPPKQDKAAPAAGDLKKAIQDEIAAYNKKNSEWQAEIREARRNNPGRPIDFTKGPLIDPYAKNILNLVASHPKDPTAIEGLAWIIDRTGPYGKEYQQAAQELLKHVNNDAIASTIQRQAQRPDFSFSTENGGKIPDDHPIRQLVNAALESKSDRVRGAAHCGLGLAIFQHASTVKRNAAIDPERIKQRMEKSIKDLEKKLANADEDQKKSLEQQKKQAESNLTATVEAAKKRKAEAQKELPNVAKMNKDAETQLQKALPLLEKSDPNLALRCKGVFNDLSGKLDPGVTAMEITAEDVDGKNFKLSDYRGKVILLDFWGHW